MKNSKLRRMLVLLSCAAVLIGLSAGVTLAYLTDADHQVNTFSVGKVLLYLDEAKVLTGSGGKYDGVEMDGNGNAVRTQDSQTYKVFPGAEVVKDPTITVDAASEAAWVAARIVLRGDLMGLIGTGEQGLIDITRDGFVSGGLLEETAVQKDDFYGLSPVHATSECYIYQDADAENETWTLYVYLREIQQPGAKIALFERINIPAGWGAAEMALFSQTSVDITAYAVQKDGFDDAYTAMAAAFPEDFPAVPAN